MQLRLFVFVIGIVPAYLNEEKEFNKIIPFESQNSQSTIQVQEIENKNRNNNCPNNKVLLQTLNILKENLVQNENQTLNPEKFKHILNTTMEYLNTAQATDEKDDKNYAQDLKYILGNSTQRSKKEVLRNSPQFVNTAEKLNLQYKLPTTNDSDCQILLKAIVNAINGARFQMNKFCVMSGKCVVHGENTLSSLNSPVSIPSYLFSYSQNLPTSNLNSNEFNVGHLGSYTQNRDTNLIQNNTPNVASLVKGNNIPNSDEDYWNKDLLNADVITFLQSNLPNTATLFHGNNFPDSTKEFPINSLNHGDVNTIVQSVRPNYKDVIIDKSMPITQQGLEVKNFNYEGLNNLPQNLVYNPFATNIIKNNNMLKNLNNSLWKTTNLTRDYRPLMEVLPLLNYPTGYLNSINSNNDKLNFMPDKPATGSNIGEPFKYPLLENNPKYIHNFTNFVANIPEEINKFRVNGNDQNFPSKIYSENINIPTLQSTIKVPKFINSDLSSIPKYQSNNLHNMQSPQTNYLNGKFFPNTPINIQGEENIQKSPNIRYYNPIDRQYFKWNPNNKITPEQLFQDSEITNILPNYNKIFGVHQIPNNQGNILLNSDLQVLKGTPISDFTFKSHKNLNNAYNLNDLYRLPSMTNSPKLNIAPNKNGIVELTFTLQHPQSFVYKPLCYVKYSLPYQTYMHNVQNLVQKIPLLRTNPAKLYGELLAVANITESSQDLKDLAKEEISKLVAANGALVKAKILDSSGVSNSRMEDEIKSLLRLTSNLNADEIVDSTKKVINNVEEGVGNITAVPVASIENIVHNQSPYDLPVKSVNTRSLRYPLYPQLSTGQYVSSSNNIGMIPYGNRQIMFPSRHTG